MLNHYLDGRWTIVDNLAVWKESCREPEYYTYEAICFTLANIKKNKATFATDEAYRQQISKFEAGRAMFPIDTPHS